MRNKLKQSWIRYLIFSLALSAHSVAHADAVLSYLFGENPSQYAHLVDPPSVEMKLNWLSEPEIRISPEQDARGLNTETYSFRFRPSSQRERTAQTQLLGLEATMTALELEDLLAETLSDRYLQIIEIAELEALLAVAQQQLTLDEDEIGLEGSQSGAPSYDLGNLQKAVFAIDLQRDEIGRLKAAIDHLRKLTMIPEPMLSPNRDSDGLIRLASYLATPQEVESLLQTEQLQGANSALEQRMAQAKLKASKHKRTLEKSRRGFGLDLLELSYENKGIDSYNLTFGFRLPSPTYGSHQSRVEHIAAQRIADLTDEISTERKQRATQNVFIELDRYFTLRNSLTAVTQRPAPSDPESALLVKRRQLKLVALSVNQHAKALRSLAGALLSSGLIYQRPLKNWIASP